MAVIVRKTSAPARFTAGQRQTAQPAQRDGSSARGTCEDLRARGIRDNAAEARADADLIARAPRQQRVLDTVSGPQSGYGCPWRQHLDTMLIDDGPKPVTIGRPGKGGSARFQALSAAIIKKHSSIW